MTDKTVDLIREAQIRLAKKLTQRAVGPVDELHHHVLVNDETVRQRGDSGRFEIDAGDEQDIPDLWPTRKTSGR